jgi:apolipoprotein N-acyltransferase
VTYGHAPAPVGVVAPALLAIYPAAFVAAFGAAGAWLARRGGGSSGLPSPWMAAALWTALEHGRTFVLTGFPWALLGYAQYRNPGLLALAPWTGVFGLSFATVLGGWAAAELGLVRRGGALGPRPLRSLAALAVVGSAWLGGTLSSGSQEAGEPARLRVAVLQGNIDQGLKWSPEWAERTLAIYETLTRRAAGEGAELVLWPETAVPGSPDQDPALADRLAALARETRAALVVGAVGLSWDEARRAPRYYDSAFVWDAEGRFVLRYDKAHLVPFGEYVPLRGLLGHFVEGVARGIADTDVGPGAAPYAFSVGVGGAAGAGRSVSVGVPICYELLFPDLVRRFVQDGAEALLAITNDAWYGRTGAPYQFLAITALRSAENRVWTARAANTGVSAIIDHHGRVRKATAIFERDHLVADVELRPAPPGGSFYARHGDWFALACWAAAGLGLARAWRFRGRPIES